jgi:hypothetical protein
MRAGGFCWLSITRECRYQEVRTLYLEVAADWEARLSKAQLNRGDSFAYLTLSTHRLRIFGGGLQRGRGSVYGACR